MKVTRVKVVGGEGLSLPAEIMERLGLHEGDEVEVDVRGGEMVVRRPWTPVDPEEYRARLRRLRGSLTAGLTTDEIMRMTRGDDWGPP